MKTRSSLCALFTASVLMLAPGCATYAMHLAGKSGPRIYRGTCYDAARLGDAIVSGDETRNDPELRTLIFIFAPIDLPLSFVADTLLLPYDITTIDEKEESQ